MCRIKSNKSHFCKLRSFYFFNSLAKLYCLIRSIPYNKFAYKLFNNLIGRFFSFFIFLLYIALVIEMFVSTGCETLCESTARSVTHLYGRRAVRAAVFRFTYTFFFFFLRLRRLPRYNYTYII